MNLAAIAIAVLCFGLFIQSIVVYCIDPDGLYRSDRARLTDSDLWNEMLVAKYGRGDLLMLGSSLSERVHYAEFNLAMGCEVLNSAGATNLIAEQSMLLKNIISRRQLKAVYWEMFLNLRSSSSIKSQFPSFAMNDSILDDWHYLLSSAAFFRAIKHLLMGYHSKEGDFNSTGRKWLASEYSKEKPFSERARLVEGWNRSRVFWGIKEDSLRSLLRTQVIPIVKQNPEVRFLFVLPPAGIFSLKEANKNLNKTGMSLPKLNNILVQELIVIPNAEIYDFQIEEMVMDFEEYSDSLHYSERIANRVAQGLRSGAFRVDNGSYDLHAVRLTQMLKKVD